ncbi:hypothetical protein Trydic_g12828 [Trypoxylus dichotomus]
MSIAAAARYLHKTPDYIQSWTRRYQQLGAIDDVRGRGKSPRDCLPQNAAETIALGQTPTDALNMGTGKYRQRLDECGVYARIFFLGRHTEKQNTV